MIRRGTLALVIGLGLGLAMPAMAQEKSKSGQERRDEAFRMVDAYVLANIQESLDLSDAQFEKVIPLVNKLQRARREYYHERGRAHRRLRRLLSSGTATEAEVVVALDALKSLESGGRRASQAHLEALDAVLSPLQQAKYRIFESDVEQRLRKLMRRGRGDDRQGGQKK